MQNAIEITHLSRKEKLRIMEAIWEDLSNDRSRLNLPTGIDTPWKIQSVGLTQGKRKSWIGPKPKMSSENDSNENQNPLCCVT